MRECKNLFDLKRRTNYDNCNNAVLSAVQNNECIDLKITWTNEYHNPDIYMECSGAFASGTQPTSSISIKVGSNSPVTKQGYWDVQNKATVISRIPKGLTEAEHTSDYFSKFPLK
jgi:hypothetical protein